MIEKGGNKESDKNLHKQTQLILANCAIHQSGDEKRNEQKNRPFRNTELGNQKREKKNINKIADVKFKWRPKEYIRPNEYAQKNQYGNYPLEH
jgi:hypothetical protein